MWIDRLVRRYAPVVAFVLFAFGGGLLWVTDSHAQSVIENSMRIALVESHLKLEEEQTRSSVSQLADHDRRLVVMETTLKYHSSQLDEITGYVKYLIVGVFSLLGMKAWERIVTPAAAKISLK